MKPNHSKLNGEVSITSSQGTPGRSNNEVKIQKGKRNLVKHRKISITLALVISCSLTVVAQTPQFNIVKPSTTGVPGEEVRVMSLIRTAIYGLPVGFIFGAKVAWQCCRLTN